MSTNASPAQSSPAPGAAARPRRLLPLLVYALLALIVVGSSVGIVRYTRRLEAATTENNKRINLAGRQRALSQRMTKALLAYERDLRAGTDSAAALGELKKISNLFHVVLRGFETGGAVPGADGNEFQMPAARDPEEQRVIREALALWLPLQERLSDIVEGRASPEIVATTVEAFRARNVGIFDFMNELTNRTEFTARAQIAAAANPRTALISTAVVALFLIPGFYLGDRARRARLRAEGALHQLESAHATLSGQSAALASAKVETDRIMDTVQEGLLLIDSRFIIGPSYSRELAAIFRQEHLAGMNLLNLLQRLLSEKMFNTTRDYFDLLFNPEQREKAVLKVNPLVDIEVSFPDPAGGFVHRYLGFSFRRIMDGERVSRVFVAVRDITAQIELEKRLREAEKTKERQLEILLGIMHVEPEDLVQFAETVEHELDAINQSLRAEDFAVATPDHQEKLRARLNEVFRSVHNIKGNAVYLRLDYFQRAAEAFETRLSELIARPKLGGEDFLAIVVAQAGLRADLGDLIELRGKLSGMRPAAASAAPAPDGSGEPPSPATTGLADGLRQLVRDIAADLGKQADLAIDDYALHVVARGRQELVRDTLIQLVRNSVAHGVEPPSARADAGKPPAARLELRGLPRSEDGLVGILLRDDGRGLDLERIRERAFATGLLADEAGAAPADVARCIFSPGFSTRDTSDAHSGRGQGMDIVKTRVVDEAGGRIEVRSAPGRFCEFALYLPEIPEPALV